MKILESHYIECFGIYCRKLLTCSSSFSKDLILKHNIEKKNNKYIYI